MLHHDIDTLECRPSRMKDMDYFMRAYEIRTNQVVASIELLIAAAYGTPSNYASLDPFRASRSVVIASHCRALLQHPNLGGLCCG